MDHRINMRQPLPLTPLFPGLNLTYALKLLHKVFRNQSENICGICLPNLNILVRQVTTNMNVGA